VTRRGATATAAAVVAAGTHLVVAAWLGVPVAAGPRYAAGAPPGFSGGFGEPSCHACHFHAEVNTPGGRLVVDGVPRGFAAGGRYAIAIRLSRPGMKLAGFQLTARFKDGGRQAGTLVPAAGESERIRVERQSDVQYVSQQEPGAAVSTAGTARWSVEWIAPASRDTVVFHLAANAADADGTVEGDYVYSAVLESAAMAERERSSYVRLISPARRLWRRSLDRDTVSADVQSRSLRSRRQVGHRVRRAPVSTHHHRARE
jgi:hypothetical protein